LSIAWMTIRLFWTTLTRRYALVHVCLPTPIYVPYLAALSRLPRSIRPKLALTVIDCTVAGSFEAPPAPGTYERQVLEAHRRFFRWTRLDGIFSWYQAFVDLAARRAILRNAPAVTAAKYCFVDPQRFKPVARKKPLVVFAGRLSEQKRPLLFVDAVAHLLRQCPDVRGAWRFEMYGKGDLERIVHARIVDQGLAEVITLTSAADLAPVFARSRLFVSTQAIENFTSLSMLEAMAAGNAVIAEDVGQTREFVHPGENGLLVSAATPEAFATAIAEYLRHPERHDAMAAASRRIATEIHTVEHFAADITAFWNDVALGRDA
jgi:glycosyltransferase involved in cell wall biosynthesis